MLLLLSFLPKGGNIHKVFLKKFNNWYSRGENGENYYKNSVQLINYSLGNAYDLSFVTTDGKAVSTGDYIFETDARKSKLLLSDKRFANHHIYTKLYRRKVHTKAICFL